MHNFSEKPIKMLALSFVKIKFAQFLPLAEGPTGLLIRSEKKAIRKL
jgi:hypothetical protein